jgi:hypothetical protein
MWGLFGSAIITERTELNMGIGWTFGAIGGELRRVA